MKDLPAEWKTAMKLAIEHVDLDQMKVLNEQIREKDEALAETIQMYIDRFEYEKICYYMDWIKLKGRLNLETSWF